MRPATRDAHPQRTHVQSHQYVASGSSHRIITYQRQLCTSLVFLMLPVTSLSCTGDTAICLRRAFTESMTSGITWKRVQMTVRSLLSSNKCASGQVPQADSKYNYQVVIWDHGKFRIIYISYAKDR
jgi:hypothetical protein